MPATNWYVDPVSGDDVTGDGTSDATAWATIQYALDNLTRNTSFGDVINVKSSGTISLSAVLSFASLTLHPNYYITISGYDSTADDGGVATIDCNGNQLINNISYIMLKDLYLTNTGASVSRPIYIGHYGVVRNVEVTDFSVTNDIIYSTGSGLTVSRCTFHDVNGNCIRATGAGTKIDGCHFYNDGSRDIGYCIFAGNSHTITFNTCYVDSTTQFYYTGSSIGITVANNTLICSSNTGVVYGLAFDGGKGITVKNNIIEGFDVAVGMFSNENSVIANNNCFYNNTYNILEGASAGANSLFMVQFDNVASGASNIAASGAATRANRSTFFAPANDAIGGGEDGESSAGAIQLTSGGGGGTKLLRYPGMQGGMSG